MRIELNKHFKPDEGVIYCGERLYARMADYDTSVLPGCIRTWYIQAARGIDGKLGYIHNDGGRLRICSSNTATPFYDYKEAQGFLLRMMESGLFRRLRIIESYEYNRKDIDD